MPAAGRSNASAVEGVSDQHIQVASVFKIVSDRQPVLLIELIVDLADDIVGIYGFEHVQIFGRESQLSLHRVDSPEVGHKGIRKSWRLRPPLALVVDEEKEFVFFDRAAEGAAELALVKRIRLRGRLQERARVEGLVAEILVGRAMPIVRPRLGLC